MLEFFASLIPKTPNVSLVSWEQQNIRRVKRRTKTNRRIKWLESGQLRVNAKSVKCIAWRMWIDSVVPRKTSSVSWRMNKKKEEKLKRVYRIGAAVSVSTFARFSFNLFPMRTLANQMAMRFSRCFSLCGRDKQFNSSSEMNWSQMKWTQKKTQTDAKKDEAEEVGASNCNRNAKSLLAFLLTTKTMQNAKQYCCSVVCAEMCYAIHLVVRNEKKKFNEHSQSHSNCAQCNSIFFFSFFSVSSCFVFSLCFMQWSTASGLSIALRFMLFFVSVFSVFVYAYVCAFCTGPLATNRRCAFTVHKLTDK